MNAILDENRKVESSVQLRCHLLLVELYFSLYRIRGETKEVVHAPYRFIIVAPPEVLPRLHADRAAAEVAQIVRGLMRREPFPDFVKSRIQFRYHIYRTLYFLEQGSMKGVKKEVKSSSDYYLQFSSETTPSYLESVRSTLKSQTSPYALALDGFEPVGTIDGYLPSLLKTRLEFRRGNWIKILSVLNQVYEEEAGAEGVLPAKDSFYYSMLSSVYCSSGMLSIAKHYLVEALHVRNRAGF